MKQSKVTGDYIFNQLELLYAELKELNAALDTVAEEIGDNSMPYKLLMDNATAKRKEIEKLKSQEYVVYISFNAQI